MIIIFFYVQGNLYTLISMVLQVNLMQRPEKNTNILYLVYNS